VLASAGEVSAADLGGVLGWRVRAAREVLDELAEHGDAHVDVADGVALYALRARPKA
jgi:predicted ArsR family transcriptional regulator